VSFVGWIIVAYIAWAIMSAIRKSPAAKVARAARRPPRSQDEAHRQLLEMLGLTQGEPAEVQRRSVTADRTAVRQRSIARASASAEVTVDHDDEAERIVRQRRREVEARNRALAGEDHKDFDARIRREEQEEVGGRRSQASASQLRKLMVWQEILGRPVGMRD
jgi:hypothetical protein